MLGVALIIFLFYTYYFTRIQETSRVNCPRKNMSYDIRGEAIQREQIFHLTTVVFK